MCGSPISGPILIIFFPVVLGVKTIDFLCNSFQTIDTKIRKNNQHLRIGMHQLKEKLLFRKQLKAESKLELKINSNQNVQTAENIKIAFGDEDTSRSVKKDEELARLYVQRAVTRIAAQKYDQALEDVRLALYWDENLEESYVWHFVEGVALYHCAEYIESAHSFKKGIELKIESGDSEKSIELERTILDVNFEMKHTHEKVKEQFIGLKENTRNYVKSWKTYLKGETTVPVEETEKTLEKTFISFISLEELCYRAGCSYYFSACYHDAIKYFDLAIEHGKNSPNLKHYVYNKGLCYFFNHELEEALDSFNQALGLDKNFIESINMISQTYGRKGNLEKKKEFINLAHELNPKPKLTTVFNYRLLSEEMTQLVFSFLPTYTKVKLSCTNKYWRELLMRSVANEEVFEISLRNLVNNMGKQNLKIENRSIREKIFLPSQEKKTANGFVSEVLSSSFFKYYLEKKGKRLFMSSFIETYVTNFNITNEVYIPYITDLEYLSIHAGLLKQHNATFNKLSPNLKELVIRDDGDKGMSVWRQSDTMLCFNHLERLTFTYAFPNSSLAELRNYPFKFPASLTKIFYNPKSDDGFVTQIIGMYPEIEFIPHEKFVILREISSYALDSSDALFYDDDCDD